MSSLKFGTSGLLDLVGRLTYDHVGAFLEALGPELAPCAPVLIGRDLRGASPNIAAAAVATAGHSTTARCRPPPWRWKLRASAAPP